MHLGFTNSGSRLSLGIGLFYGFMARFAFQIFIWTLVQLICCIQFLWPAYVIYAESFELA